MSPFILYDNLEATGEYNGGHKFECAKYSESAEWTRLHAGKNINSKVATIFPSCKILWRWWKFWKTCINWKFILNPKKQKILQSKILCCILPKVDHDLVNHLELMFTK